MPKNRVFGRPEGGCTLCGRAGYEDLPRTWQEIYPDSEGGTSESPVRELWIAGGGGAEIVEGIGKEGESGEYINHVEKTAGKKEEANMYRYWYETGEGKKKETHEFQWITNIELSKKKLEEMIEAGRGR